MKRTRLRSRVLTFTAANAVLLIGIAFVLTWRAQISQGAFQRLLETDSRMVLQLEELSRTHNAFVHQWTSGEIRDPARYRSVKQLLEAPPLADAEMPHVRRRVTEFEHFVRTAAPKELQRHSRVVTSTLDTEIDALRARVDLEIRRLSSAARNTMWVALGIVYIIAILSFAVARVTLLKLVRPLEDLSHAAEQVAREDFSARAPVAGDQEVAQLALAFNQMAEQLAASHDALRERARTDELTGLPNFRAFRESLAGEIERARRYKHTFALLVFDIDHFKKYNDEFGHLGGNEALKVVADTIRHTLRSVDLVARYGGEEFVAVLPEIDPEGLATLAERVRVKVAAIPPIQGDRRITISVGGALYPLDGNEAEQMFEAADTRLYAAKKAGRNRVITPQVGSGVTTKS